MAVTERADRVESRSEVMAPFAIEADHPRNSDLLLQAAPGIRLRSAVSAAKPSVNLKTGAKMINPDQSSFLGQFPPIPGQQITVNPAKLSFTVYDPLTDDEELCQRIATGLRRTNIMHTTTKVKGVATMKSTLDVHRMKTLVRELKWIVDAGEGRVVKGTLPTMEEIEALPGHFLLNPGTRVRNSQPIFEKDFDAWLENLTKVGG